MITNTSLKFLRDLKKNNQRDWFNTNKKRFDEARAEFESFVAALIPQIAKFDKSVAQLKAKDCIFRIYRDIRFSKDKSPYKTFFGAHISPADSKTEIHSCAGYYLHLEPGATFLAGGAYMPEPNWLNAIRKEIDYNAAELKKIINAKEFKKYFGTMEGEKLSRPPKGFEANHPEIELLKYKSFLAVHKLSDKQVTDKKFVSYASKVFHALYPLDSFLNRSMD